MNDPSENPYAVEFLCVAVLLIGVLRVWQHVRPRPRTILRCLIGAACTMAFVVMQAEIFVPFDWRDRGAGCLVVLEACLFVAGCMILEIVYSRWHVDDSPRARARPDRRRRHSSV